MATPRKTDFAIANASAPWTLRSAGGSRPTLIVWGSPAPAESILDRLARAGLAVLTPPERTTPADLVSALASVPAPLRVALVEPPTAEVARSLDVSKIPWRRVTSEWDELPGWFTEPAP